MGIKYLVRLKEYQRHFTADPDQAFAQTRDETQSNHESIEKVRQQNSAEISGSTANPPQICNGRRTRERPPGLLGRRQD